MRRLLVPHLPAVGGRIRVEPAESHHLLNVLRAPRSAHFRLVDGAGEEGVGVLTGVDSDGCAVLIVVSRETRAAVAPRIVLLGVPKPALLEEAVTLGTEAGATRFVLVRADFSPPGTLRLDRLERVLHAAVTQCGRADLPVLEVSGGLSAALDADWLPGHARWLASPGAPSLAAPEGPAERGAVMAIGPEGGWSPAEAGQLTAAGFVAFGLGPFILRTPTAVAAALARLWVPSPPGPPVSRS